MEDTRRGGNSSVLDGVDMCSEAEDELISINNHMQNDEVLALEAIYGDDISCTNEKEGLRLLQINVNIKVPEGFKVSSSTAFGDDNNSKESSIQRTFTVHYLPPIILTCSLPQSYPSHCPPLFSISAEWLDDERISALCHELHAIWREQRQHGQEVIVYQWVEWLRVCSLSHLNFSDGISLRTCDASSSSVIPCLMISYDLEKCNEAFISSQHDCAVCLNEYAGTAFVKLPCKHFFCRTCMEIYCNMHVKEGTVTKLSCPDAKCDALIPPGLLKKLLGEEAYDRWEHLLLQKTLDSMSDVVYCPRCQTPCLEDEQEKHAQCSKCYLSFCSLCRERRHVGVKCVTPEEKLSILQQVVVVSKRQKDLNLVNELMSIKEILGNYQQCPSCKMAISRIEGCNRMKCRNCGQKFCYRCGKKIDLFRCGCGPFDDVKLKQFKVREMNGIVEEILLEKHDELHGRDHHCPTCHQINIKVYNINLISCLYCQSHYCALCGETVKSTKKQHYGLSGGCKLHTAEPS